MLTRDDRRPAHGPRVAPPFEQPRGEGERDAAAHVSGIPVHLLLHAVQSGVAVTTPGGRILAANQTLADLLGVSPASLVGQPLKAWLRPTAGDDLTPAERPAVLTAHRSDGTDLAVACAVSAVRTDTGEVLVTTVHDVTERARAEGARREVHDLTEQLRRAQKLGALGRLAGGVAHDFNNLLQVIGGQAEALGGDGLDAGTRRRLVRTIRGATDRAASLTRQLLAFGRRQVLVPDVIDLNVTVGSMERMMGRVIGDQIQFVSVRATDLAPVRVDPGQIEQVVINLVLNARDAMPDGGTLEISTANVCAESRSRSLLPANVPDGAWVLVTVRDSGCGMTAATAAQAFEPFFTTKDASHGSGLGLSMVYGIVQQSGGYTWIDSTPGRGTSVHVLLPAVSDGVPASNPRGRAGHSSSAAVRPGTILLVEDDPEVRALFSTFLRQAGHDVIEAVDGTKAVETFDVRAADIDLVITDVAMPNGGGPALAAALKTRRPGLKILYVSGHAEGLDLKGGSPAGFAYLQKPVRRLALLGQVDALLAATGDPLLPAP